ncbi:hypothetical protein LO762_23715 [Actinocorallia sp. API 0066]|nr:hypothetical protein [Actinocorallia sp. API 0066]MCD0452176.1 hypothetical protein [Actinocorallia sp. API 0066]
MTRRCETHSDPFDCPDRVVSHAPEHGLWGLIIHDGGSSVIGINFCPWCGAKLE